MPSIISGSPSLPAYSEEGVITFGAASGKSRRAGREIQYAKKKDEREPRLDREWSFWQYAERGRVVNRGR
jgi:hypothetical protein